MYPGHKFNTFYIKDLLQLGNQPITFSEVQESGATIKGVVYI